MRFAPFFAAFLSLCLWAVTPAHADDLDAKKDPAATSDAGSGGNEFDNGAAAAFMEDKDSDKPPSLDEYNNIPTDLMIPAEAAQVAGGPIDTGISVGSGKYSYENLMKLYQQGKYDEVAKNLEPLARGGHHGAQELIGIMYRYGQGVTKDPKKAYEYLAEAANANRPLAQYHLATMYFAGEGVEKDEIMALMWLQIAIVHFSDGPEKDSALQSRDNMYTHLTRREKDRALQMAREWLTRKGEGHLLDLEGL